MKPECPLDSDTIPLVEDRLEPLIFTGETDSSVQMFQLSRYTESSKLISTTVANRKKGKSNAGEFDWADLVNQALDEGHSRAVLGHDDKIARLEKAAALKVLYASRISVLVGSAGVGKSTLIKALCRIDPVVDRGVLLLAPTGKARVRLEQASGMAGRGQTVAQFLHSLQRYDGITGRYYINPDAPRSSSNKTVVIDECSMLTEEQLAALLDALKGVERLILVGDPRQLPPIGAGATVCGYRRVP